jgi:hypothetical protein
MQPSGTANPILYVGYYCLGAENRAQAIEKSGIQLWYTQKPSALRRMFTRILLGVYWVSQLRVVQPEPATGPQAEAEAMLRSIGGGNGG